MFKRKKIHASIFKEIIDINTFIMKHTFFVSISRNIQISPKPCFDTEQKTSPSEFLLCTEIMAP